MVLAEWLVPVLAISSAIVVAIRSILCKYGMMNDGHAFQGAITELLATTAIFWVILLMSTGPPTHLSAPTVALFVAAGVLGTAAGRVTKFVGIERLGASVNTAAISSRPVFSALLALVLLGENLSPKLIAGILVLVCGLVLLSLSGGGDRRGWTVWDLLFPLLAAALFAIGNVIRRFGFLTTEVSVLEAVTLNETGALITLGAYMIANRDTQTAFSHRQRRTYLFFFGSGILAAVSFYLFFAALSLGQVAVVDPLSATAPLFTLVLAAVFLRDVERVTARMLVAAVLIIFGAALILT